jgi:peptidoglycan/LPS O-acetylase OafA/YrhL
VDSGTAGADHSRVGYIARIASGIGVLGVIALVACIMLITQGLWLYAAYVAGALLFFVGITGGVAWLVTNAFAPFPSTAAPPSDLAADDVPHDDWHRLGGA